MHTYVCTQNIERPYVDSLLPVEAEEASEDVDASVATVSAVRNVLEPLRDGQHFESVSVI
jgi:hypothetical protein